MIVMVVGGIMVLADIRQEEFPAIDPEAVQVTVEYRGASPAEVEESICIRIEEAIDGTANIDRISTVAAEGACNVTAELVIGSDVDAATSEIENRVNAIDTFPTLAEKPRISKVEVRRGVIKVAISGQIDERDLKLIGQRAREEVAALPEISQVELRYDRPFEISIEVSEETLRRHGINLETVAQAVRSASLDLPGGSVKTRGGEVLLRAKGQRYTARDFEDIVVLTRTDGTIVRLRELGEVIDGFEDTELRGLFNGDPSVILKVLLIGDEDALEAAAAVKRWLPGFRASLPEGVATTLFNDESQDLVVRLGVLRSNGLSGLALVLIILTIFLRFRLAMWVAAGVPISFLGAAMLFPAFGLTISTMTVMAFILVLGILVDDAIVIGESVHTFEKRGGDRLEAAVKGTQAVYTPVFFGVMTSMAAFLPIVLVPGRMGSFFGVIGYAAILCLIFSLVESQLVLPAHLAHRRVRAEDEMGGSDERRVPGASRSPLERMSDRWALFQSKMAAGLERVGEVRYRRLLDDAIEWRYAVVVGAVGVLVLTSALFASGRLRYQFFPQVPGDIVYASLTMQRGVPMERTQLAIAQIQAAQETLIRELDERTEGDSIVVHSFGSIGEHLKRGGPDDSGFASGGSHLAEIGLELVPSIDREIKTEEVISRWRELTGRIPDAVELKFESDAFGAGEPVNIELFGARDLEGLVAASAEIKTFLAQFAGVADIADSFRAGKEEVQLSVRESALPLGLTQIDLARQVRQAFYGEEAQRVQRGRDDVRVMVRFPESERRSLGSLEEMRIRTQDGAEVPFAAVAEAEVRRGFASIRRTDRRRVLTVTAQVDREITTPERIVAAFEEAAPELLAAHPGVAYRLGGEQAEQADAAGGVVKGFTMALMIIYVLLAIPLSSYSQPLIIMAVIPFGAVGAVLGHFILGWDVVFFSVLGIIALSGVVVNASLVMVHSINAERTAGRPMGEAVRKAAILRFRPIVLTTATTFFGLLPLMFEKSVAATPMVPMAISLGFGVLYASVMTLFLVPVGYVILEDVVSWRGQPGEKGGRRAQPAVAPSEAPGPDPAEAAARTAIV